MDGARVSLLHFRRVDFDWHSRFAVTRNKSKPASAIRIKDLEKNPVWKFINDDRDAEMHVQPVKRLPVVSLKGKLIGTVVSLANRAQVWALIGNLDATNAKLNEFFVTLSFEKNGKWFHLARYHDPDYRKRGPGALAKFLGLSVPEVFPVSYDTRHLVKGKPAHLKGTVLREPRVRLTRKKIIALAVS